MESRGATGRWKWVLPLLLLALIPLFLVLRRQAPREMVVQAPAPRPESQRQARQHPLPQQRAIVNRFSASRRSVSACPSLGVESKLITFIEDPTYSRQGNLVDVRFGSSSRLIPLSSNRCRREQLRNVAEILKAYPNVNVKSGGYTDNAGDDAYNLRLSADRADNTLKEIANLGVDSIPVGIRGLWRESSHRRQRYRRGTPAQPAHRHPCNQEVVVAGNARQRERRRNRDGVAFADGTTLRRLLRRRLYSGVKAIRRTGDTFVAVERRLQLFSRMTKEPAHN